SARGSISAPVSTWRHGVLLRPMASSAPAETETAVALQYVVPASIPTRTSIGRPMLPARRLHQMQLGPRQRHLAPRGRRAVVVLEAAVGRPARLQLQRGAVGETEERGGQVLDLEGAAGAGLARTRAEADPAAAELAVCGGAGRQHFGLAHQVHAHVEHVDAE